MAPSAPVTAPRLVRVLAPHFVAGIVVEGERCVRAAPILRWCVGREAGELRAAFAARGWRAHVVRVTERDDFRTP